MMVNVRKKAENMAPDLFWNVRMHVSLEIERLNDLRKEGRWWFKTSHALVT